MTQFFMSDRGEGERTVLFLHGLLGCGRNLGSLARVYTKNNQGVRVLLPDLIGHGRSSPLEHDSDLYTVAQDLLKMLEKKNVVPPYTILGHSLGGRIALAMREIAPYLVSHVTLLDISPGAMDSHRSAMDLPFQLFLSAPQTAPHRTAMKEFFIANKLSFAMTDWLLGNLERLKDGQVTWRQPRDDLHAFMKRSREVDLWPVVEQPEGSLPLTLNVIFGGASNFVSGADQARFKAAGATVERVDKAGHFLHAEQLFAVADLLPAPLPFTP